MKRRTRTGYTVMARVHLQRLGPHVRKALSFWTQKELKKFSADFFIFSASVTLFPYNLHYINHDDKMTSLLNWGIYNKYTRELLIMLKMFCDRLSHGKSVQKCYVYGIQVLCDMSTERWKEGVRASCYSHVCNLTSRRTPSWSSHKMAHIIAQYCCLELTRRSVFLLRRLYITLQYSICSWVRWSKIVYWH